MNQKQQRFVYIGTYARKEDAGIYTCTYNADTGSASIVGSISGIENPSFLALDNRGQYLYAVSETLTFHDQAGGSVAAFAIEPTTGDLKPLNQQPTYGGAPCYVSLDRTGTCLLVANYMGGNVNLFPLSANGEIEEMAANVQHSGKGSRPDRQEGPHPHAILVDAGGHYAFVPDLGLDRLFIYQLDIQAHRLIPNGEIKVKDGAGPRHLTFHPSGNYAYLINELDSTIIAFAYDAEPPTFRALQTVSTLPQDFAGENTCAEIHVSPSGAYLYGSNRGHNSLAVFRIQPDSGQLTFVEHVPTGKTPRNFTIAPDGRYLLAANQDSDTVVTYAIEQDTGRLHPTGAVLNVPRPVCIQFL